MMTATGAKVELSVEQLQDGEGRMLWLKRMLHRDERGIPHWEVVTVERFAMSEGDVVVLGACGTNNEMGGILAVVRYEEDAEWFTGARQAWRVDVENQRFVALSPTKVRCINGGYGL